ncbi:beta-ketoacyl synthase N-terminal-like domain-containing protein [Streptomyces sp. GDS52]|uniref:Beta-ketoacyl synthase N-terminal-like domain-containing protein n=1 Tax=Streptomyces cathayae TaxID=3031124 RepID=A0ABY8JZC6_9ACTN|nr:beta-ketoacyl synthase N-terminal-like domain-containing protein [Streptomyces sp. HUAS 5]WGD39910.1 beta-ketoacyl synthase N-terminal-like domain-containing protein [Streptomyces sp. HUAS 5]
MSVVVSGVSVLIPGADSAKALAAGPEPGAGPVEPAALVGRKGLRYKDRATQLGYCLTAAALADAGLLGEDGTVSGGDVGVVVSSNYGNLDTVVRALDTLREGTVSATSPMDLPNASSNVIASSAAIRYGLRGPNLMVCNGATSGLDAVHWATTMITAGRVDRVLVIGVEPDNDVVRRLLGGGHAVDGGAAVVLENAEAARARGARVRAVLGRYVRTAGAGAVLEQLAASGVPAPAWWHLPDTAPEEVDAGLLPGVERTTLPGHSGRASGALGVLQCATVVGMFDECGEGPVFVVCGTDADDASAGLVLLEPPAPETV